MDEARKEIGDGGGSEPHVADQLIGKRWGELEVLEHAGYLLFPDCVYRRTKDGKFEADKVALRVPRQNEVRKARVDARRQAVEEGLDQDRDRDLVSDIETVNLLSVAIRNATPPHEPWVPDPRELEKRYDRASLMQVWAKIDALHRLVDPAPHSISEEEMFALVAAIAKDRSISPLVVFGPDSQATFIIFMADLLRSLLESRSSSEPSGSSTPESSTSTDSSD